MIKTDMHKSSSQCAVSLVSTSTKHVQQQHVSLVDSRDFSNADYTDFSDARTEGKEENTRQLLIEECEMEQTGRNRAKDFWHFADLIWHRYHFKLLMFIFLLFAYVVLAAMIMVILEESEQSRKHTTYHRAVEEFQLKSAGELLRKIINASDVGLVADAEVSRKVDHMLKNELRKYGERMRAIYDTKDSRRLEWDFWNATLFGLSLFTTIGYQHIYPVTTAGKIATIILASFGIPLLLNVIQHMAVFLHDILVFMLNACVTLCKRMHRRSSTSSDDNRDEEQLHYSAPVHSVPLPFSACIVLLLCWIFACPLTILIWETEWQYLDAFYYFFLSFTTIGLDMDTAIRHHYLYLVWLWAVFGLALLSLCFKTLHTPRRTLSIGTIANDPANMSVAHTDMPSDWCTSTISLASGRFERSTVCGASTGPCVKSSTPRLKRKQLTLPDTEQQSQQKRIRKQVKKQHKILGNRKYDLIVNNNNDTSVTLAIAETDRSDRSSDALTRLSDAYSQELKWLRKIECFSETQSLDEMTVTDAFDENKFLIANLQFRSGKSLLFDKSIRSCEKLSSSDTTSCTTGSCVTPSESTPMSVQQVDTQVQVV